MFKIFGEKLAPWPGFEPRSLALQAGALSLELSGHIHWTPDKWHTMSEKIKLLNKGANNHWSDLRDLTSSL